MPTLEESNALYRSVIKYQSVAIVILMAMGMLSVGWYMSRMQFTPSDIMQEVKIQGENSTLRQQEMQQALIQLEAKGEERATTVTQAMTSIQEKLEDHDIRLERIEKDYILRKENQDVPPPDL